MYESERDFLYWQVLEEVLHDMQGAIWEEHPGQAQPNKWGSEREWGHGGKCLCWGLVWSTQAKDVRGFHWRVWMSLCHSWESRKRTCGRDQPYHTGAPGHLGKAFTACLWGCWGTRKIWSLKNLQYSYFMKGVSTSTVFWVNQFFYCIYLLKI